MTKQDFKKRVEECIACELTDKELENLYWFFWEIAFKYAKSRIPKLKTGSKPNRLNMSWNACVRAFRERLKKDYDILKKNLKELR